MQMSGSNVCPVGEVGEPNSWDPPGRAWGHGRKAKRRGHQTGEHEAVQTKPLMRNALY